RRCDGSEVEQSGQVGTPDHSSLTARGTILIAIATIPALRINYGAALLCIHYLPNVGAFFLLNQFPEPLQLQIGLRNIQISAPLLTLQLTIACSWPVPSDP